MSRPRAHVLLAATILLPLFTVAASAGPGHRPRRPGGAPVAEQGSVPADWLSQVQRSIQLEEYGTVEAGEEFRAGNSAQRFESRCDGRGVRLQPTDAATWE